MERRGQRGANDSAAATYASVLGANLIALYDASLGIATVTGNVDTWTDQIGGRVAQAPGAAQRPVYAADGTKFGGKPVVQCALTGSLLLRASGVTAYAASGTKPWLFCVFRWRNVPSTVGSLYDLGVNAAADSMIIRSTAGGVLRAEGSAVGTITGPNIDTNRHSAQVWVDAVNSNLSIDNAAPITLNIGGLALPVTTTALGIGSSASGAGQPCDVSIALWMLAAVYPGAAAATAIDNIALAEFPP